MIHPIAEFVVVFYYMGVAWTVAAMLAGLGLLLLDRPHFEG